MTDISRRGFLVASAAGLAASSYAQTKGANERLKVGVIGCGGMAQGHMQTLMKNRDIDNVEIVTVCDLYQKRLDEAAKLTGAKPVADYRAILDDKSIDYVLIATPEHWHSKVTLDAAAAGKHIYCEKPMTRTIEQAKKVVAGVKEGQIKMQVGVQGTSDESYAKAYELIKSGAIGTVVLAQIDYSRNTDSPNFLATHEPDPDIKPGVNLDWNRWLGSAPKVPFDANRFLNWREYWDYSGGISSDLFVHRATRLIKALGLTFPERGAAAGGKFCFKDSPAEIPDTLNGLLDYPQGLTVQLISSMANGASVEHMIRGHKATLVFTRTGYTVHPEPLFKKEVEEVTYKKTGAEDIALHHRNLMNAIRKNEPLNCDVMLGYYGVVASEMVVQSYRQRKYLRWDAKREKLVKA
jgi:predicted dehydrogenase